MLTDIHRTEADNSYLLTRLWGILAPGLPLICGAMGPVQQSEQYHTASQITCLLNLSAPIGRVVISGKARRPLSESAEETSSYKLLPLLQRTIKTKYHSHLQVWKTSDHRFGSFPIREFGSFPVSGPGTCRTNGHDQKPWGSREIGAERRNLATVYESIPKPKKCTCVCYSSWLPGITEVTKRDFHQRWCEKKPQGPQRPCQHVTS